MYLTLREVRRIATEVASSQDPNLEVALARGEGESAHTELILTVRGCRTEPCQIMVVVDRDTSEGQLREALEAHLREHLDSHRTTATD